MTKMRKSQNDSSSRVQAAENSQLLPPSSSGEEVQQQNPLSLHNSEEGSFSKATTDYMSARDSAAQHQQHDHHLHDRLFARHASSFRKVLEDISKSEREEALLIEGVGPAAFLIRDAVLGEVENPAEGAYDPYLHHESFLRNTVSVVCRRICSYRPLVRFQLFTAWALLLLTFIEPPPWCHAGRFSGSSAFQGMSCPEILGATGVPAAYSPGEKGDETALEYYPNSLTMLITRQQSRIVETTCLTILAVFKLLRIGRDGMSWKIYTRRVGFSHIIRYLRLFCIIFMSIGLMIGKPYLNPFLRLALLATFLPGLQHDVILIAKMLPEISVVLAILAIIMVFYGWFGCVMFLGTDEGDQHFPSLIEAMWTLWICVTTANYPDVMMPAYNKNRWTALFFVSFMIISFFFFMNVILASVANAYNSAVDNRKHMKESIRKKNLKEAFRHMDPNGTGRIDRDTVMALFLILNLDFPEFRTLSNEDTKLLFAILDKDGTSTITEDEFMDFGNVLLLEFTKSSDYATFVETRLPKLFASPTYQRFCKMVKSSQFEFFIDFILLLNAVVVGIQSYPELSGAEVEINKKYWDGSIDTVWETLEAVFTVIYVLEVAAKTNVYGWKRYMESQKNVFDFTITVLAVISSIIVYYPNQFSDSRIIKMIVIARVLRLLRLLTAVRHFQLIVTVSSEILPAAYGVVLMLFLLMYFFSVLGVHLYGGLITRDPGNPLSYLVLNTDFSENDYWANNFNDAVSGMNVLFNLLVVNNWTECEVGFEATTQGKWVRLFFLSFHICGVIVVNNLVTGLIINEFLTQLEVFKERTGAEVVGGGEAILYHRQAIFNAAQITGTKTSLRGDYIARFLQDPEDLDREQDRLRGLFTQTSKPMDNDSDRPSNTQTSAPSYQAPPLPPVT